MTGEPQGASLAPAFFERPVVEVARGLIGCELLHEGVGGVIVETEAYDESEPACHAYVRTARSEVLFGPPAHAYVYLSYGIHQLFNVVTGAEGSGAAVLIRALEPHRGIESMRARRRQTDPRLLCSGPGRLTEALAIGPELNRAPVLEAPFALHAPERPVAELAVGSRVGISKATELPWRFWLPASPHVSRSGRR